MSTEVAENALRLSREVYTLRAELSLVQGKVGTAARPQGVPAGFSSEIVRDFPPIFDEFRAKKFELLWEGERDGFGAEQFHRNCDGHGNTLTLILDTQGNVFGGFTPLEWETPRRARGYNGWKADDGMKSFLFTLRNPHNLAPRKFGLRPDGKERAYFCDAEWGPHFGDIMVSKECNSGVSFAHNFGSSYENTTGLMGETFFTGGSEFKVKRIEVFEIRE